MECSHSCVFLHTGTELEQENEQRWGEGKRQTWKCNLQVSLLQQEVPLWKELFFELFTVVEHFFLPSALHGGEMEINIPSWGNAGEEVLLQTRDLFVFWTERLGRDLSCLIETLARSEGGAGLPQFWRGFGHRLVKKVIVSFLCVVLIFCFRGSNRDWLKVFERCN
ncbi:hypothetical protein CDAR_209161 [Caerostris darwini]|uniref:Uncharacterized protein n=1 Tax=Caerostris darwini TaxID=1538125 RepID=A0AAV4VG00_9ARAC|nr:hypothetical protein CDAR_209161 [Caerostris darwini]